MSDSSVSKQCCNGNCVSRSNQGAIDDTGMSQWSNLTAAQRQWLTVDLESRAYDAMVIRLLLVD